MEAPAAKRVKEDTPTMALYVKRLSDKATLPVRASAGAAGYDLFWYDAHITQAGNALDAATYTPHHATLLCLFRRLAQLDGHGHPGQGQGHRADRHQHRPSRRLLRCEAAPHAAARRPLPMQPWLDALLRVLPCVLLGGAGRVAPRSGLAVKHFLDVGAGVIDADYRGAVGVVMFNFSDVDYKGRSCILCMAHAVCQAPDAICQVVSPISPDSFRSERQGSHRAADSGAHRHAGGGGGPGAAGD